MVLGLRKPFLKIQARSKTQMSIKTKVTSHHLVQPNLYQSGGSLNGANEKGPNRLNDLSAILLRFRRFQYAFTADISEMCLKIRLTEADKR
jgi:hypothetical protein